MVYLDHAATTPVPRDVADAMYEVLTEQFGNPSSQYGLGLEMKRRVGLWRKAGVQAGRRKGGAQLPHDQPCRAAEAGGAAGTDPL